MKRVFVIMLAFIMIFACSVPCFAATDGELGGALAEYFKNLQQDLTSENFTITEQHELSNGTVAFSFTTVDFGLTDIPEGITDKIDGYYCNGKYPYFYSDGKIYRGVKTAYDNGALNTAVFNELSRLFPGSVTEKRPDNYREEDESTAATPDEATPDAAAAKGASGPAVKTGGINGLYALLLIGALAFFAALVRRRRLG